MRKIELSAGSLACAFRETCTTFEKQAWDLGQNTEDWYDFGGRTLRLRFNSPSISSAVKPALNHLRTSVRSDPHFTVCLCDSTSFQVVPNLRASASASRNHPAEVWLRREGSIDMVFRPFDRILNLVNVDAKLALCWVPKACRLPFDESVSPLRHILSRWLRTESDFLVHAGAVGGADGGLLLGGSNGTGKSTTALLCLKAGIGFVGDNYVLIRSSPSPSALSLYSSASLRAGQAARFPQLLPAESLSRSDWGDKIALYLNDLFPEKIARSTPIRGILLPQVTRGTDSRIHPASSGSAMRALISNSISPVAGKDRETFALLAALARELPVYRLALGSDLSQIPNKVSELLSCLSSKESLT